MFVTQQEKNQSKEDLGDKKLISWSSLPMRCCSLEREWPMWLTYERGSGSPISTVASVKRQPWLLHSVRAALQALEHKGTTSDSPDC